MKVIVGAYDKNYEMTTWKLISLEIRWKWVTGRGDSNLKIVISEQQLEAISLARYYRTHLHEYAGLPQHADVKRDLAEAEAIAVTVIAQLAEPIHQMYESAVAKSDIDFDAALGGGIRK